MPVKVKDFVIQANFEGSDAEDDVSEEQEEQPQDESEAINKQEIIDECIERVLKILRTEKER